MPTRASALPSIMVKERSRRDPTFLDLDPLTLDSSRHYRWVRCRSDEHMLSIAKTKLAGYIIETLREGGPRPVAEGELRPDKVIAVGDLILMSCPLEHYHTREEDSHAKTETLLASATAQTTEMAKQKGISIIKDPDHSP